MTGRAPSETTPLWLFSAWRFAPPPPPPPARRTPPRAPPAGKRGVVIVQLWNGFAAGRGQPLYDPFVVGLMEAALANPAIKVRARLGTHTP